MKALKIVIFLLLIATQVLAQEGQFSQYFASPSLTSPAFAGVSSGYSFNTNYKRGGLRSSDSYLELFQATFTYPFIRRTSKDKQVGGAGLTVFKEGRGYESVFSVNKVLLTGSYNFQLDKLSNKYLIFGLQAGVVQQLIDIDQLLWGSQFNQFFGFDATLLGENINTNPIFYPVFNFGVLYSSFDNQIAAVRGRSVTIGVSVDNINRPKINYGVFEASRLNMLFKAFGAVKFPIAPRWDVYPSFYALYTHGNSQLNAGTYFSTFVSSVRSRTACLLYAGGWYRVGDSMIMLMGLQVDNIRMGLSLDLNSPTFNLETDRKANAFSTYELSLTYNFGQVGSSSLRQISSPIF